jgi:uncharacterized OB-fold protein
MLLGELTSLTTCPRCGFSIAIYPNQEYTKCKNCEKKISLKIYEFKGEKEMIDKYFELNQQINKFEEELDKCVTIEQKLEVQNKLLEKRKDLLYKHIEYGAEIEGEIEMINSRNRERF